MPQQVAANGVGKGRAGLLLLEDDAGGEGACHVAEEAKGPHEVDGVDIDADVSREVDLRGAEDGDGEAVGDVAQPRRTDQEAVETPLLRAELEHVHPHRVVVFTVSLKVPSLN